MTLEELRRALELVEPYRAGDYCLVAEHDELRIYLSRRPDDAVTRELQALNCPLSWMQEDDDGNSVPNADFDGDSFEVTCFT
jgi:uncharacterized protein YbgA (DUF1722 family)